MYTKKSINRKNTPFIQKIKIFTQQVPEIKAKNYSFNMYDGMILKNVIIIQM